MPSMIPPGQALMPQNAAEEAELQRDGRAAGLIATLLGITNAHRGSQNLRAALDEGSPTRAAASVGQVAMSAIPFSGLARTLTSSVPRMLGTGAGMGLTAATADGMVIPSAAAAEPGSDAVRKLQLELRDSGDYTGPIDGIMKGQTEKAVAKRDARERAKNDAKAAADRSAAELATSRANAEAARAQAELAKGQKAKTDLEAEQEKARQLEREAGSRRLREGNEGIGAGIVRALQNYGPYAGYLLGGLSGLKGTNKLYQRGADRAQVAATRADDMMAAPIAGRGQAGVTERVGRVNQFWDEGQRGGRPVAPFTMTTPATRGAQPGYRANPEAPPAGRLYQPTPGDRLAAPATVGAAGLVEAGLTEGMFAGPYRRELKEAQAAVEKDPSEANIQRLESARNKLALAELAARIGLGTAGGAVLSGSKNLVGFNRARPNTAPAEAMRGDLVRTLSKPKAKPKPRNKAGG